MPQKTLLLVSVGSPPVSLLRDLQDPLAAQMGVTAVVSKTMLTTPAYAFNKDRGQYHCNAIMRRLTPMLEPGQFAVLGISDVDLFVPDSPFVFGEADRESKTAVMSLHRLAQGAASDTLRRRAQVEVVHQAGHLLGLSYCEDPRCVMFFAQTPQDCDRKQLTLCNLCRNELQKLNR
ncbi:non-proteolytic archaemetzincin-like protein [Myxococcus sp. AM009]|uniref:non-proteolytic archaemetzincin-like protein n=1 Tax=unclassified Myxococcus TaxID=2648731 RepID=UPI0015951C4A|nr:MULTISPECIES: non-proteolytic archaemetzincin-like protein [unclassified Myxococcus]NVI99941.1 non-proteolytic archaemetzincin-like protein [Myxococcus sp. AM009]NVJ17973.1 non-proteolytic archaemetzincin-like protein [Myxococcus sp. AM010]